MLKEFKEFAMRGNVVDLAVGIIIGGAFSKIVDSLVKDVIMPPIGLILGNVDFSNLFLVLKQGSKAPGPYETLKAAQDAVQLAQGDVTKAGDGVAAFWKAIGINPAELSTKWQASNGVNGDIILTKKEEEAKKN